MVFVAGILLGGSIPTGSAEGGVPDWFKGVAKFWAEGGISTEEFLQSIQFLIAEKIITVPGFAFAAEGQDSSQDIAKLQTAIDDLQMQIDNLKTQQGVEQEKTELKFYTKKNTFDIDPNSGGMFFLECDKGDQVISGGYAAMGLDVFVTADILEVSESKSANDRYMVLFKSPSNTGSVMMMALCLDSFTPDRPVFKLTP